MQIPQINANSVHFGIIFLAGQSAWITFKYLGLINWDWPFVVTPLALFWAGFVTHTIVRESFRED